MRRAREIKILQFLVIFDQSIASMKTKYIKLNTETQNIFCRLNENLMTFFYTLTGATRKQKEKCIQKSNVIKKILGFSFMYLVLVDAMD